RNRSGPSVEARGMPRAGHGWPAAGTGSRMRIFRLGIPPASTAGSAHPPGAITRKPTQSGEELFCLRDHRRRSCCRHAQPSIPARPVARLPLPFCRTPRCPSTPRSPSRSPPASSSAWCPRMPTHSAAPRARAGPTACGDFDAFANQNWLTANPVPDIGAVSALGQLQARVLEQQRELLSTAMNAPQGPVQTLLGDFWASGLDQAAVEADGARPIAPLLDRINGIKRAKDIPPAIAALHQVGIPVVFNFSADLDLADLDRHIGYFAQGGTGLPDPAYYTREDADSRALLGLYNSYVQKILALTGTTEAELAAEAQAVIDIETRIARASLPV